MCRLLCEVRVTMPTLSWVKVTRLADGDVHALID